MSKPHAAVSAGPNQYCYDANGSQTRRITAGTNQVTNPGFESSGSWSETRDVNFPGTSFLRSTAAIADEQTDSYGYAISNLAYGILESASIAVTGNTNYNLFAYLRGELDTEDSESGGWIVRAMFYDANNTALPSPNQYANAASGSAGSLTTTWTQKGGQIKTPANAAFVRVRLYNYYNSGWAAFDDVSLVKVGTSTNLAANPGFESSGSWTEVRNSSFPATAFWRGTGATASPRSGTYAYAISNHATGKLISNPITVTASSTYSLSAWLRGELDAEGSEGGGWNIQLCTYDVDQVLLGCTSAAVGGPGTLTTAWAQKGGTVSTPAGAVQARIQLSLEQGSGWAAFDDVSLVKVGNTTNLAPTPGFESTGGWSTSRDASFPGTSFYRGIWGTADGRSGDYGHVISSHMYGYLQSSAISATPGGVYDVYSWMRGELDADDSGGSWVLRVYFYNSSGTLISSSDAASGGPTTLTTAWQRKGGQVTAPAGTASLKVWLMVYMNSGWAAFDDVSVTQPQTAALTYDAENRLVSVSGSGVTASFVYDGDGNRVQSTINGVTTVYIGNYYEKSGDNITKYYYAGAMRVAMKSGSGTTWLLGDHLGSTSLAVNGATGQESSEQRYMPFGEVRYSSGALPTKYTFTGQYSNVSDFGLMYYGARWYDVSLGRFASADTIIPGAGNPQSWDRYSYTLNNPVKYTDPSGHGACDVVGADPECNDPSVQYAANTDERMAAIARLKRLAGQPMLPPSWNNQRQRMTIDAPSIGPSTTPFYQSSAIEDFVEDFAGQGQFYRNGKVLVDAVEAAANVGTPVWRQVKGPLPGGFVPEFFIGGTAQLSQDLTDRDTRRSAGVMFGRALVVGVEDGITESISTPVAGALVALGTGCGPGAPACAGALYLAGSIGTTWAMDTFVWKPINQQFFNIY